jgi:uncharacterized RmlC-like cupin family protein
VRTIAEIEVTRQAGREVSEADATTGMVRERAFGGDVWAGIVKTAPNRPSGWHHHGHYETYFYVMEGQMRMEFGPGGSDAIVAGPGDFVHVPAETVHREVNPADTPGAVVLMRIGNGPPVVNVDGPAPRE